MFRSNVVLAVYETAFDYVVKLSCLCYAHGCRAIYDLLMWSRFSSPVLVAVAAAAVLVRMGGFRNVLKLPFVVYNDNAVDRYRPPSTLTFSAALANLPTGRSGLVQGFSTCGPRSPGGPRELPRGPRATPEKLETRRILTKQNTGHINVVGRGYNVQN